MFGRSKEQKAADAAYRSAKDKLASHRDESPAFWADNDRVAKAEKSASLWARLTA